jgi:hypothetical protein
VDVFRGPDLQPVWQSTMLAQGPAAWDGATGSGSALPGEYWWSVGARRVLGAYSLTVYGYLSKLTITQ